MPPIRADVAYNTLAGISFSLFKEYKEYHKKQKHNREYGIWNADRGRCGGIAPTAPFRNPRSAFRIPYSIFHICAPKTAGLKTPGFIQEFMKIGLVRRGFSRAGG